MALTQAVMSWGLGAGPWRRTGLAFVAGGLLSAGHAPLSQPLVAFVAFPLMAMALLSTTRARQALWVGWVTGFAYLATTMHWVGHAFLVDPDKFALLIPLGVVGLPSGLALFWALAFWGAARLGRGLGPRAGALVVTIAAAEVARSYVLTGLPWALPAYIWAETPIAQSAAWIGPFGLTLMTTALCMAPVVGVLTNRFTLTVLSIVPLVFAWVAGDARQGPTATDADAPVVRIVQPNAPQALKWQPGHRERFFQRALDETAAPAARAPDFIVWPEMSVFFVPDRTPQGVAAMAAAAGGKPLIYGAFRVENTPAGDRWTNALMTLGADGKTGPFYDKHHLVPFGEYIPFSWILGRLGVEGFTEGLGMQPGPGPRTLRVPGVPAFSALICYEAIFPYEVVGDQRPEMLVQLTNDAWFGAFAGPQQHLAQARFRAIEQGLPMVRAANTGISAMIDPFGRVTAQLGLERAGHLDAPLPRALAPTLYARTGDWPPITVIVGLLIVLFVRGRDWSRR